MLAGWEEDAPRQRISFLDAEQKNF